jgi:hypothetical protein
MRTSGLYLTSKRKHLIEKIIIQWVAEYLRIEKLKTFLPLAYALTSRSFQYLQPHRLYQCDFSLLSEKLKATCVITRRTLFELRKSRERAHLLEGLAIALMNHSGKAAQSVKPIVKFPRLSNEL